ncbi:Dnaj homolog subfamily c member 14 [Phtheirospermum japonicum]|uniref:Dnaj homolog subfamily c member 14 n=1 Tax=Phtheirospermum japonicum TaxID=374723 RepID=A0A830BZQ3_9LAMI|nr:Dnaj homolog subfamily c member 14 [Phtheirospermum japonicum]
MGYSELFKGQDRDFHGAALADGLLWLCENWERLAILVGLLEKLFYFWIQVFYGAGISCSACHYVELLFELDINVVSSICAAYMFGQYPSFTLLKGAAGAAVQYLGYTPGLFIVGLFAILILWMYANFWITGTLFIVGGYLFSLNHARLLVFMATTYAMYCVKVKVGWVGVFLSINLAFLSNDVLNYLIKWCDNLSESTHFEERKESDAFTEEDFSTECGYSSAPTEEVEDEGEEEVEEDKFHSCKSASKPASSSSFVEKPKEAASKKVVKEDASSIIEMERILNSGNHYEALGFPRQKKIDVMLLKKEYRRKAMLVHPDKNMGSPLASESFKKLQCAYEVLSDVVKKRDYDEHLIKEESKCVLQKSASTSYQTTTDFCSEESRRIQCTKCGNSHIWVCTNRTKAKARWCQDCCQYHQAKDGDGWVEYKGSLVFDRPQKVEIPRAFVCAESRIFDVSEWAICQTKHTQAEFPCKHGGIRKVNSEVKLKQISVGFGCRDDGRRG